MAAGAVLNIVAAVAPDTCRVFENVGWMPKYSLKATLKRWNGEAKAWHESTPSRSRLSSLASARAFLVAEAASQRGLLPGTLPTGDIPMPMTATLPRRGL